MDLQFALQGALLLLLGSLLARGQVNNCPILLESQLGDTTMPISSGLLAEALDFSGGGEGTPTVQLMRYSIVCLAQGTMRDTYRSLSLIAAHTDEGGVVGRTITQLNLQCTGGMWTFGAAAASMPTTGTLDTPLRTDCIDCDNLGTEAEHCLRELLLYRSYLFGKLGACPGSPQQLEGERGMYTEPLTPI